jgi:hypothetical protein
MIRRIFVRLFSSALMLVQAQLFAQMDTEIQNDTLAEVGKKVITARDLIERVELMPWPGKDNPGEADSAKVKALQSLVGEQILAQEAAARGLGNDSTMRGRVKNVENLMVRDELYRREVQSRIQVSQQEILQGIERFAVQMKVLMIGLRTEREANAISLALQKEARPDSVIAHLPDAAPATVDTVTVSFGLLERKQEDVVYALDSTRRASPPVNVSRLGWVVLYLIEMETDPEYARRSIPERIQAVTHKIRRRKELDRANRYYADLLAGQRAEADPQAFDLLAGTIYDILSADSVRYRNESGYRLDMVVDAVEGALARHLNESLVKMGKRSMTLGEVLEGYRTFSFALPNLNRADFRQRLNASIREVVAREFVAREGYRKGLEKTGAVRHDVATWTNYWLARRLEQSIINDVTVGDEEVLASLLEHSDTYGGGYEVSVREILVDSLTQAIPLVERINAGSDMSELARNFSKRKEWAVRGGESGFFPVREHPEIGFRAMEADTGTLVGPAMVTGGYSTFVVLGKRQLKTEGVMSYDSLRSLVRNELYARKARRLVNAFVATAAKNHNVNLYYRSLKKVDVKAMNMVTKRLIGFGGSMVAIPPLTPLWEWVRETKDVREIFP